MSVSVAAQELDGTPSTGLKTANFRLSGEGQIAIREATETAPGIYRLVIALDLYGPRPQPQRRILTVTHASFTHAYPFVKE